MVEIIQDTGKRTKDRNKIVVAKCHCGKLFESDASSIRRGRVSSCGCSRIKDITGKRFGLITVVEKTDDRSQYNHSVMWKCKCDCGTEIILSTAAINHPDRRSCGCDKSRIIKACKVRSGKNHHWYNPNLLDEDRVKRNSDETYEFTKSVLKRDNYTCQKCGQRGGDLCAHHLNSYHWFKEGRTDPDNGGTLCEKCHKEFHATYGMKYNTIQQYNEYTGR